METAGAPSVARPWKFGRSRKAGRSRRWRGFSLFGVLLGLAVAGVVIVGSVALYNQTQEAAGRSEALTLLSQLKGAVERTYAGRPNYGAAGTDLIPTIDRRGGIPSNARVMNGTDVEIWHPFDAQVNIEAQVGEYTIEFEDLDDEICAALADVYVGQTRARTGLVSIQFNGGTANGAPVTVAQVTTGCNAGASDNDITFRFG